ncbi:MAG: hypothetical protein JRI57_00370 [Deltaproteobacteria bacterium]|nr:hypothetical protein [Deltaproteobacteria bacterium]MBW1952703.1 hypothetical protein [Deltaproteobacteria bacterium]MBW1986293.1 hypothetical protein [Deltaproteobacteria bacterium]MBW2134334.1 hypothetical protein [Deltaproteobacteria bacterium]
MGQKAPRDNKYCIWMQAGVVKYKLCDHNYDCNTCPFDQAMTKTAEHNIALRQAGKPAPGKKGEIIPWQDKMRQRAGLDQKCRHMLTGRIPAYFCAYNYECYRCPFDQMLEEQLEVFTPLRPQVKEIFGFQVPTSIYLHCGHAWAAVENAGRIRIGLDDFSQRLLGPAEEMQLPNIGDEANQGVIGLALARQGKKAAVMAPVDGIIEAVNPKVRRQPRLAHDDPYGEGWLFVVNPTNLKPNLENLLFGDENMAWTNNEAHRLLSLLESSVGVTLPDGGTIVDDVFGHYPQLGWERLVREFLLTG